jgi:G3E family GTPase
MPRPPLPLTVIGGFLGAGKTTLLNRWLREAGGRRLAVLVNDFGAINLDAALVASSAGDVVALTNGCVCCQIGDDLGAALVRVLDAPQPFDAVVIEASGVSDPARIGRYGRATPDLVLDGVIVLVDAATAAAQAADPLLADTLQRQVAGADVLIVNKTDVATPAERAATLAWLDRLAPGVPRVETAQAEVPLALLSSLGLQPGSRDAPRDRARPQHEHEHEHEHGQADGHPHGLDHVQEDDPSTRAHPDHGDVFETWSSRPRQRFAPDALRALLSHLPAGVLRVKGVLRSAPAGWSELQVAGRRVTLRPLGDAPASGAAVVAIGLRGRLPCAALEAVFADRPSEAVEDEDA